MSARRRAARRKLKQLKNTCNYGDDLDLDDDNDDELGQFNCVSSLLRNSCDDGRNPLRRNSGCSDGGTNSWDPNIFHIDGMGRTNGRTDGRQVKQGSVLSDRLAEGRRTRKALSVV